MMEYAWEGRVGVLEVQRSCFVAMAWNSFHPYEVTFLKQHH